ncbi:MAG: hypothetical protein QNJ15_00975 [Erythrobacter sp.]|nr:hypothetical protein [Erythrobacter sp.]
MTKLPQQFVEDRALRDAARDVLMADIEHARNSISGKGIAARIGSRVGDGAKDVFEVAKGHADDNRGILAALVGAIVLFFAREPILEIFGITPEDASGATAETDDDIPADSRESAELESDVAQPAFGDDNDG